MRTPTPTITCPICGETVDSSTTDRITLRYIHERDWFVLEHMKGLIWDGNRVTYQQHCAQAGNWRMEGNTFVKD